MQQDLESKRSVASVSSEHRGMMEKVQDDLDVSVNFTNAQDHKLKAERNNRTKKEGF